MFATDNTTVNGATIENWNTSGQTGGAGIRSTAVGGATAVNLQAIRFLHSDNSKTCMNLAAGPRDYVLTGVTNPSGNPLFDTVHGIDPGAENLSVGSVGSLTLATTTSKLSQFGTLQTFTLPQSKAMTFTFEPNACHFIVSVSNGKAGEFFAEHATAAITIVANPASFFVNSGSPSSGHIGVSKGATARVVTVTNNASDGDFDIAIQTLGGRITAITDPV